jgi:hypothetical protein
MKTGWRWSLTGTCLLLSLLAPMLLFGQENSVAQAQSATAGAQPSVVAESAELPDSPGAVQSQNTSGNQSVSSQQSAPQPNPPQPPQTQQPATQPAQAPVGTAAARTSNPSGIAASEPAGAAIAPAKQRRTRIILISVAAVLGAAAAVGIVAGLSAASPSRPPGAH